MTSFKGDGGAADLYLNRARLRTLVGGEVVTEDVILCERDEWAEAVRRMPTLAAWRAVEFPNGQVVAAEPFGVVADRILGGL